MCNRNQLAVSQNENKEKMHRFALEEKHIREENVRLQRKLQQEVERREALCRHLSESESSLEMEEERQFNEALSVSTTTSLLVFLFKKRERDKCVIRNVNYYVDMAMSVVVMPSIVCY